MGKIRLLYLVVCSCLFKYCFKTSLFALILFLLKARYNGMDSLIELIRIYLINVHSKIQKPLMIIPCWAKEVFDIPAQTMDSWFRWIPDIPIPSAAAKNPTAVSSTLETFDTTPQTVKNSIHTARPHSSFLAKYVIKYPSTVSGMRQSWNPYADWIGW